MLIEPDSEPARPRRDDGSDLLPAAHPARPCEPNCVILRGWPATILILFNSFTPAERDLIRREFCMHFSSYPALADGMFLRIWRAGPQKGQPKIPKAMDGLVERGLMSLASELQSGFGRRAYFTEAGVAALRELLQDRRSMNPQRFAHLRQELGLDPVVAELVE